MFMDPQPQSLVARPSSVAHLLGQLALDVLPPTISLEDPVRTLTDEPESLLPPPTITDVPPVLTNSRDSSLTVESAQSLSSPSRESSFITPAGPSQNSSITSLDEHSGIPLPLLEPINNHLLHTSTSSPTLRGGTSILRFPSGNNQSILASSNPPSPPSPTSPPVPSVKFAPLPEIERTRKRKHSQKLGVAARSQLLSRRRQMMHENSGVDQPPDLWRSEEQEEDPFVALGHMVKLASIGMWRKVSMKGRKGRPKMQKRSNSDSILEIARPVTYIDAGDEVLVDLVDTTDDNKTPPSQTEAAATTTTTTTTSETSDDKVEIASTDVTPVFPFPTN